MQEWPQSGEVLTFFIVDKKEPALSKSEAGRRQLIFSPFRTAEVMPLVVTSFQEEIRKESCRPRAIVPSD
ncbi:MAG: hypothetical protein DMG44_19640 [Acidobacteria bacterium]|nr:MAG: hypothetical protein DMG44_19640 [Acidobacteriota bacterium]